MRTILPFGNGAEMELVNPAAPERATLKFVSPPSWVGNASLYQCTVLAGVNRKRVGIDIYAKGYGQARQMVERAGYVFDSWDNE